MTDERHEMGKKAEGILKEVGGRVQEAWGDLTGSERQKKEGQAKQAEGVANEKEAEAMEKRREAHQHEHVDDSGCC